jgi:NitT/TauT family transport system substrate-binding protein
MKKIVFLLFSIVCIAATAISGCRQTPDVPTRGREAVTIGIASLVLSAPLIIAQEKGYFTDEGLSVTIQEYQFGKLALDDVFAGKADLATVAETPIVMSSFKRNDFLVLASFVHNYDDSKIVVRKDRQIRAAADLAHKKIGATFGTSSHFFLDIYLSYNKVRRSEVTLIDIPQKELARALQQGEVDAIAAFEPYAYQALTRMPGNTFRLQKSELLRETFNLAGKRDYIQSHPDAVKRVLRAIDRGVTFIHRNRDESIKLVARKLHSDEKYLQKTWDDFELGLSLDQSLLLTLEDVAQWAINNIIKNNKNLPNYLEFIHVGALQSVKPEAVRILK